MPPAFDDPVLGAWEKDLRDGLVTASAPDHVRQVAAAAAAAVPAGAIATGAAAAGTVVGVASSGMSLGAKVALVGALVAALGGAAAAGVLPDPIQRWIADVVDDIGIEIPRPPSILPDAPEIPVDVDLPLIDEIPVDDTLDLLP